MDLVPLFCEDDRRKGEEKIKEWTGMILPAQQRQLKTELIGKGLFYKKSFVVPQSRVAQSIGHLSRKSEILGSIPGLATYVLFSFR